MRPHSTRYITAPQKVVSGTIMPYLGLPDATKRADLIV
jgi:cytochrome c2